MEPTPPTNELESKPVTTETPTATTAAAPTDTPTVSQPTTPTGPSPAASQSAPAKSRRRMFIIAAAVAIVVLLGGGYVFGMYLPNQPDHVYKSSLTNSGKALDTLITYSNAQSAANYKSYSLKGEFKVKSSQASADGSLSGKFSTKGAGELAVNVDALGQKMTANIRSVKTGTNTPDIYFQVSGVKSLLDTQGLNSFDSLDGQWLEIDHTVVDTLSANVKKTADASASNNSSAPTLQQVNDAAQRVNEVNKKYIFSTDPATAVLTKQKFVGKETKDGRPVDHYKVDYDRAHLQAYVAALGPALDASTLNSWAKKNNNGKSLSEIMKLSELKTQAGKAPANYSFDLWADTKTKLVHSVQFVDPKDPSASFTLAQNYTGGSSYPFSLATKAKDGSASLSLDLNTNSGAVRFGFLGSSPDGTSGSADITLTPSTSDVTETAPAGAKSINDILAQLGAQGVLGAKSNDKSSSAAPVLSPSDLETFFQ